MGGEGRASDKINCGWLEQTLQDDEQRDDDYLSKMSNSLLASCISTITWPLHIALKSRRLI